jgi:tetratricopeptide (TPR) repeat protein
LLTEVEGGEVKRIRQRKRITIMRDDHIGDLLGAIFLDVSQQHEDSIMGRLAEYLGERVRIVKAEISYDRAEVEVEVKAWEEEASRLAATAKDLNQKGAHRNAQSLYREALELDPLNVAAASGLGTLLAQSEKYTEALAVLKFACEVGPPSAALLLALAQVCIRTDRTASAITYLERAFEIDPSNFGVRRALTELGRKPKPLARGARPDSSKVTDQSDKPTKKHQ